MHDSTKKLDRRKNDCLRLVTNAFTPYEELIRLHIIDVLRSREHVGISPLPNLGERRQLLFARVASAARAFFHRRIFQQFGSPLYMDSRVPRLLRRYLIQSKLRPKAVVCDEKL